MKKLPSHHSLSSLASLLMLLIFSVALLAVLLGGANVYDRLTQRDSRSYDSRTCTQYLTTKVRQSYSGAAVSVASFGDGDSLVLSETIGGTEFHTQIYCHDGYLMELFTVANAGLTPNDGAKILPAQSLTLTREGTLLHLSIVDGSGTPSAVTLHLRGEEGSP